MKEVLRNWTFQIRGRVPGNRGPLPTGCSTAARSDRPSARSSAAAAGASSIRTRSTELRLLNGAVGRTSPTRTGINCRLVPEGSDLATDSHRAWACGERT